MHRTLLPNLVVLVLVFAGCADDEPEWVPAPQSLEPTPEPPAEELVATATAQAQFGRAGATYVVAELPVGLWGGSIAEAPVRAIATAASGGPTRYTIGALSDGGRALFLRIAGGQRAPASIEVVLRATCGADDTLTQCAAASVRLRVAVQGAALDAALPGRFRAALAATWRTLGPRGEALGETVAPGEVTPAGRRELVISGVPLASVDADVEVPMEPMAAYVPGAAQYFAGESLRPGRPVAANDPLRLYNFVRTLLPELASGLPESALEAIASRLLLGSAPVGEAATSVGWALLGGGGGSLLPDVVAVLVPEDPVRLRRALSAAEQDARGRVTSLLESTFVAPTGEAGRRIHSADGVVDQYLVELGNVTLVGTTRAAIEASLGARAAASTLATSGAFRAYRSQHPWGRAGELVTVFAGPGAAYARHRGRTRSERTALLLRETERVDAAGQAFRLIEGREPQWGGELLRAGLVQEGWLTHSVPCQAGRGNASAARAAISWRPGEGAISGCVEVLLAESRGPLTVPPASAGHPAGTAGAGAMSEGLGVDVGGSWWVRVVSTPGGWSASAELGELEALRVAEAGPRLAGGDGGPFEAVFRRGGRVSEWLVGPGGDGMAALGGERDADGTVTRWMVTQLPDPVAYAQGLDKMAASGGLTVLEDRAVGAMGLPASRVDGPRLLRSWEPSYRSGDDASVWMAAPPGWLSVSDAERSLATVLDTLTTESRPLEGDVLILATSRGDGGWLRIALARACMRRGSESLHLSRGRSQAEVPPADDGRGAVDLTACLEEVDRVVGSSHLEIAWRDDGVARLRLTHRQSLSP